MTIAAKKNENTLPSLVSDFFEKDRFFGNDFFNLGNNLLKWGDLEARVPSANVIENGKDFRIELAAPGLEKKDFKIEVENNYLTISAEKKEEKREEKENYRRREFSYSGFSRSFLLPDSVLADKIDATYQDGILKLSVPKKEPTPIQAKKEIKVF
jgi:HSP20 family protein